MNYKSLGINLLGGLLLGLSILHADEMEQAFRSPPDECKPSCYWYWFNGDVTKEGITKDLETMAKVGIRRAMIGNIQGGGPVKMLSPEWYTLTRHALREAARVGVEIYMFNAPGWSQSGGPWIKPEQSMRRVIWNEIPASGGSFSARVRNEPQAIPLQEHNATGQTIRQAPQDIAVLAVPCKPAIRLTGRKPELPENELSLARANWIWFPGESAASAAPAETRRFRYTFEANGVTAAQVMLTADNEYVLRVNGKEVKRDGQWQGVETVAIREHLRAGANTVEITVRNVDGAAGLIAAIQWQEHEGRTHLAVSGPEWQAAKEGEDVWRPAESLGPVGMQPWNLASGGSNENVLVFRQDAPFKARALIIHGSGGGKLYAVQNGERRLVADIQTGGRNPVTDFLPDGIETFSFAEATAREFRLEQCNLTGEQVVLTSEPTVAQVVEKQLGRMHPDPSPRWDSYVFPATVEPDDSATVIRRDEILNLTGKLGADGVLTCKLPEGAWNILYFGMVTTGKVNSPAPPEASGLEVDKMSRPLIEHHFNSMFGKLLEQLTPEERSAFAGITIDSYEKGSQNWTDHFAQAFKQRNGYDPVTLLPVFTGRVVDSAKTSDQFLWDLRRTVADMIATEYIAGLRDIAHRHKLRLWCENYGHWGFPSDFLIYGAQSDEIAGEFWSAGLDLGTVECRAASSAAHIYGKPRVYAEAFTSVLDTGHHPYAIKARGEQMFCEGINQFVLHVYSHQPRDGAPGKNSEFGTAFHRNNPWFNEARDWVRYLQRCHYLLQQGEPVADVAVYIGDFAPQMTGPANPVPNGYDYDYIGSDAISNNLDVIKGKWVVYDEKKRNRVAASYELLAMPESGYIRPQVRKRIEELKNAGGKVVEASPVSNEVLQKHGVVPIVAETSCPIRWKARRLDDGMVFFLSNFGATGQFDAKLRVTGKAPELFNPATGEISKIARYKVEPDGTRICINIRDRSDSFFVVFREKPVHPSVIDVKMAGNPVSPNDFALAYDHNDVLVATSAKKGTYTLTMSNGSQQEVTIAADSQELPVTGEWKSTEQSRYSIKKELIFPVPAGFGNGRRVMLDLGNVEVMAKVVLNGHELELLWMPPFELDVTNAIKNGDNTLTVTITSTLNGKPKMGGVKLKALSNTKI